MANKYTTTYLLAAIKRRGMLTSNDNALADADFLALADEEVESYICPLVMQAQEGYFDKDYDVELESGTAEYFLPPRAMFGKLKLVKLEQGDGSFQDLDQIPESRASEYSASGSPEAYYLKGNSVIVVPAPSSSGQALRMVHARRPNLLVETDAVGEISSINTGTKTVVLTATKPTTFTTSVTYDFVRGKPGFDSLGIDATASSASGTTLIFDDELPDGLAVGDYVCLAGESPIPQIPPEMHALLAQRTVAAALSALGDDDEAKAEKRADRMAKAAQRQLTPRVSAGNRVIVNRNGPGWRR